MKNLPLLIGTLVISIALIVGIALLFSRSDTEEQAPVDQVQLTDGASVVWGQDTALVTIVEFSDFQCPACKAAEPFVRAVQSQYPDSVRVVYRYYPLDQLHPYARTAAQAAQVANTEGKFWEYADMLYENQDEWSSLDSKDQVKQSLSDYATELGIDSASFLERMDSTEVVAAVQNDVTLGTTLKIMATPTFYVNGVQTSAPELLDAVKSVLNQQS